MDQPGAAASHDRHVRSSTRPRRRPLAVAAVLLTGLVLSGCQLPTFGAFRGSTSQGQDAFKLWQFFFIMGIIVGGFVILLILWSVFRYRRRSDEMPKQTQYHTGVEILYTVVPIVIVLVLFAFTVITENKVDATPPADVTIRVTAFQWGWRFYYPATGKVVTGETKQDPQMWVPTGESVQIMLGSADVIHGFYVPAFNFSRYAQPGVTASQQRFNFTVLHNGVYRGQCTQLCGLYHSLMFFNVKAVSPAKFQVWVHHLSKNQPSISQLKQEIQANGPGG